MSTSNDGAFIFWSTPPPGVTRGRLAAPDATNILPASVSGIFTNPKRPEHVLKYSDWTKLLQRAWVSLGAMQVEKALQVFWIPPWVLNDSRRWYDVGALSAYLSVFQVFITTLVPHEDSSARVGVLKDRFVSEQLARLARDVTSCNGSRPTYYERRIGDLQFICDILMEISNADDPRAKEISALIGRAEELLTEAVKRTEETARKHADAKRSKNTQVKVEAAPPPPPVRNVPTIQMGIYTFTREENGTYASVDGVTAIQSLAAIGMVNRPLAMGKDTTLTMSIDHQGELRGILTIKGPINDEAKAALGCYGFIYKE